MSDWSVKKDAVGQQLRFLNVDELTEFCEKNAIAIPPTKVGNRDAIHTIIMRYMNSETIEDSEDQGLQTFTTMDTEVKRLLALREEEQKDGQLLLGITNGLENATNTNSNLNNDGSVAVSNSDTTRPQNQAMSLQSSGGEGAMSQGSVQNDATGGLGAATAGTIHYHMKGLREFKIHGGFVASGDSPISYSNLKYQMDDGRESQKFTEREIMSGVIRAIKPNSILRQYLESERNMGMKDFLQHIKNHYKLSSSGELLTTLASSVQGQDQEVQEYIDQIARLRNDIITISNEEGRPIDPQMVKDRYLHAITVGLTKETIRLEIQALIKSNPEISDVDLGAYVQKVVSREKEHEKKMEETKGKSKGATINRIGTGERSEADQAIFNELGKITAKVNEISTSKSDEISALKQQMFLLQSRQEELGALAAGGYGYDLGWQGQDGSTYYNNSNNYGGFSGNGGGGQMNRGRYGNGLANRGGLRGGGNNRGNFGNKRGGGRGNNNQNYQQYQQQQKQFNGNQQFNTGNNLQNQNGSQQNGSNNRGSTGGIRGGRGSNRGGFGNRGRGGHSNGNGNRNNFVNKCQECQLSGAFCTHCSNCGDANHKYRDCPENE